VHGENHMMPGEGIAHLLQHRRQSSRARVAAYSRWIASNNAGSPCMQCSLSQMGEAASRETSVGELAGDATSGGAERVIGVMAVQDDLRHRRAKRGAINGTGHQSADLADAPQTVDAQFWQNKVTIPPAPDVA
jgi:hypothetical protein